MERFDHRSILTCLASFAACQADFIAVKAVSSFSLAAEASASQSLASATGLATGEASTRNRTHFSTCSGVFCFLSADLKYENSAKRSLHADTSFQDDEHEILLGMGAVAVTGACVCLHIFQQLHLRELVPAAPVIEL